MANPLNLDLRPFHAAFREENTLGGNLEDLADACQTCEQRILDELWARNLPIEEREARNQEVRQSFVADVNQFFGRRPLTREQALIVAAIEAVIGTMTVENQDAVEAKIQGMFFEFFHTLSLEQIEGLPQVELPLLGNVLTQARATDLQVKEAYSLDGEARLAKLREIYQGLLADHSKRRVVASFAEIVERELNHPEFLQNLPKECAEKYHYAQGYSLALKIQYGEILGNRHPFVNPSPLSQVAQVLIRHGHFEEGEQIHNRVVGDPQGQDETLQVMVDHFLSREGQFNVEKARSYVDRISNEDAKRFAQVKIELFEGNTDRAPAIIDQIQNETIQFRALQHLETFRKENAELFAD